jgi:hypothetical protein
MNCLFSTLAISLGLQIFEPSCKSWVTDWLPVLSDDVYLQNFLGLNFATDAIDSQYLSVVFLVRLLSWLLSCFCLPSCDTFHMAMSISFFCSWTFELLYNI